MMIKFGSVCSGIEAASVAWEPLGFKASWLSEIETFPSEVLAYHWPAVSNLGDMCGLPEMVSHGTIEAPDILVGGTPCQTFSIAGERGGISDERGLLTLKFIELADAIDEKRQGSECIIVWENVPGVLSSKDNAFGCFLGKLSSEDTELQPTGKRWSNAGCVFGTKRTVAWRILDAQYFGVAQRRRRVFVIASARDGFDPTRVLFESEGLRRDIKPSREKGQNNTPVVRESFEEHGLTPFDMQGFGHYGDGSTASTCKARDYKDATDLVVYPIQDQATRFGGFNGRGKGNGFGIGNDGDPSHTLTAADKHAVFFADDHGTDCVVRRLTPIECERLQGFPDNHTQIPWRGKEAEDCPKGQRYKAIGNSMAVPVINWIGQRIMAELTQGDECEGREQF